MRLELGSTRVVGGEALGFRYFKKERPGMNPFHESVHNDPSVGANSTLPYDRYSPTKLRELFNFCNIPGYVAFELRRPEINIVCRHPPKLAPGMIMPVATMYEYDYIPSSKNDIGAAGETLVVETVPKPSTVQSTSNHHLGRCVL